MADHHHSAAATPSSPTPSTTIDPPSTDPPSAGSAAALVLGSWLTTHACPSPTTTSSDDDDQPDDDAATRFRATELLGSLLAAGAADAGAMRGALLEQALREGEEDPVLRVAALWAWGQGPRDASGVEAVVRALLPGEQREEEGGGEEEQLAALRRLFLQHLQLPAGGVPTAAAAAAPAPNNPSESQQPQQPAAAAAPPSGPRNPPGALLPPRTGARDHGAGALQAAAVRALMLHSASPSDLQIRTLIHLLHSGRSAAVARLAARALLGLPAPRLGPHVRALARAAWAGKLGEEGWRDQCSAAVEEDGAWAAALLLRAMMGGGEEDGGGEGGHGGRRRWRPNTVVFEALYTHLPPSLLRPLAAALLSWGFDEDGGGDRRQAPSPSLVLAPFLAVPALRAQLTLEEVGAVVRRVERAVGLAGGKEKKGGKGEGTDEETLGLFAVDAVRLVLLHSAEVRSGFGPVVS